MQQAISHWAAASADPLLRRPVTSSAGISVAMATIV
jgi:hypothetical protein